MGAHVCGQCFGQTPNLGRRCSEYQCGTYKDKAHWSVNPGIERTQHAVLTSISTQSFLLLTQECHSALQSNYTETKSDQFRRTLVTFQFKIFVFPSPM